MTTIRKTRKFKTNSFTSILDQILNKYNLLAESNLLQLRAHANKLGTILSDWKARKDVGKKLTIKERAQYCAKTGDVWDIWLHALDLAVPKNNTDEAIVAASSYLSQFRKELAEAGVDPEPINTYAKLPNITQASNKIQKRKLERGLINLEPEPETQAFITKPIDKGEVSLLSNKNTSTSEIEDIYDLYRNI
ncbi:1482_t:CDS:2 [Ambispora gerdemannii]|uniref:1482_t:CDS:1 n=1 Tax=Ambispora gerdemannii TaxID=144530 RepID=A0A9N9DTV7_9GLOM|nr:1482_t:CDS:2 [Ambispora gerdemannii]